MLKKQSLLAAVVLSCAVVLAGCQNNNTPASSTVSEGTTTTSSSSPTTEATNSTTTAAPTEATTTTSESVTAGTTASTTRRESTNGSTAPVYINNNYRNESPSEDDETSTFYINSERDVVKLDRYHYVWGDEFDETSLDSEKWALDNLMGTVADFSVVWNDKSIFRIEDGELKMNTVKYYDPTNSEIRYAVAPCVSTKRLMNFRYGYLEMRAKVPYKHSAWPGFWMQSAGTLAPPECEDYMVEVDIFEVFSSHNTLTPSMHKWYADGNHVQYAGDEWTPYVFTDYYNLSNEYHLYGFEWTPTEMAVYVDGVKYSSFSLEKPFGKEGDEDMSGFQDNMFIILDNWLFTGNNAWDADQAADSNTEFPLEFHIDWIRLYQDPSIEGTNLSVAE